MIMCTLRSIIYLKIIVLTYVEGNILMSNISIGKKKKKFIGKKNKN